MTCFAWLRSEKGDAAGARHGLEQAPPRPYSPSFTGTGIFSDPCTRSPDSNTHAPARHSALSGGSIERGSKARIGERAEMRNHASMSRPCCQASRRGQLPQATARVSAMAFRGDEREPKEQHRKVDLGRAIALPRGRFSSSQRAAQGTQRAPLPVSRAS